MSCTTIRAFKFQIGFQNDGLACGRKLVIENPHVLNYVVCLVVESILVISLFGSLKI